MGAVLSSSRFATRASSYGDELEACTEEELRRLRSKRYLPCIVTPTIDFDGENELRTLYVAEYERGVEWTFLFRDEDRPSKVQDCLYDWVRRPCFGRWEDVETVFYIEGRGVVFPGTYSGHDQTWKESAPRHGEACVPLDRFETTTTQRRKRDVTENKDKDDPPKDPGDGDGEKGANEKDGDDEDDESEYVVVYVNTWNHLMGERNNNTDAIREYTYMYPVPAAGGGDDNQRRRLRGEATSAATPDTNTDTANFVVRKGSRSEVDARFHGCITSVSHVMTPERQQLLGKRIL